MSTNNDIIKQTYDNVVVALRDVNFETALSVMVGLTTSMMMDIISLNVDRGNAFNAMVDALDNVKDFLRDHAQSFDKEKLN